MRLSKTHSITLLLFAYSEVQAQTESTLLNALMVKESFQQQSLKDLPLRTEVITAAELEKMHAKTLEDALKYTASIDKNPLVTRQKMA